MTITVLIVNYNSSDFVSVSLHALEKLTKNSYQVFILDNNSQLRDYHQLQKTCASYQNVVLEKSETTLRGSEAHGAALNYLVGKVNTPYFCILDADATWLIKNWDEILIKELDGTTKIIGTQAPPPKDQTFPLMFAALFDTEAFLQLGVDFRPIDIKTHQDTGYEMKQKYLQAGYSGKIIDVKNTRTYKKGPYRDIISAEYYLNGNCEHIFASHYGRGSTNGENKYRTGTNFLYSLPIIGKHFRLKKGKREKEKWINISLKIIEKWTNIK